MKPRGLCNEVWRRASSRSDTTHRQSRAPSRCSNIKSFNEPLTNEGYNPKMVRERTGYKTLSGTRMLTSCDQPLLPELQSFNIQLSLSAPRNSASFRLRGPEKRALQRRAQRPHVHRHHTHTCPVLLLRAVAKGRGGRERREKKKFEARWEIFKFDSVRADCRGGATSV